MSEAATRFYSNVRERIPWRSVSFVIHLTGAVLFSYALYYDCKYVRIPDKLISKRLRTTFGGRFKYLTFWDHIVQTIYFNMALFDDLYEYYQEQPNLRLRKVRDYLFASIAFPIGLFVSTFFWTLYNIDRELIFPAVMDKVVPSWLNHFIHTNVGIFPVLEMITLSHEYPKRIEALMGYLTFTLTYIVWVHIIHYNTCIWVYPFLRLMDMPERCIFFGAGLLVGVFWYFVGEIMNRAINGNVPEPESEAIKED